MRRFACTSLLVIALVCLLPSIVVYARSPRIRLNGGVMQNIDESLQPIIIGNHALAPLYVVMEAIGFEVELELAVLVREITTDLLWDRCQIQAFEWGGDVIFVGRSGTISQIPEFRNDELYFP